MESQPSARNIKTVEAKTVGWLCVRILCFTPHTQPPFLPEGALFSYFCCLPVVADYLAGLHTLYSSAYRYGCSLDIFGLSDLWLTAAQTPQLISSCHAFRPPQLLLWGDLRLLDRGQSLDFIQKTGSISLCNSKPIL